MALKGVKVVEMLGLAPGPFCGTILADFGASVTVIQKYGVSSFDVLSNGKRALSVNLKSKNGVTIIKKLCSASDVLLDTFRPGVLEKLGLAPEELMKANSKLIYARLTGYGQNGFYRDMAGHDINYVAVSGVLSLLTQNNQPPKPPINLLADFAGGSLMCALGIVLALYERTQSGKGQIVDASMTAGTAYLASWIYKSRELPIWTGEPGTNILDGGIANYGTFKTKDNKFMAVGALEPQFYTNLLKGLQLSEDEYYQSNTDKCHQKFKEVFLTKTQEEWTKIFERLDACVTPVIEFNKVDKHSASKDIFYRDENDMIVPKPAPQLSRTPALSVGHQKATETGEHTLLILQELGYKKSEIDKFINEGTVYVLHKSRL